MSPAKSKTAWFTSLGRARSLCIACIRPTMFYFFEAFFGKKATNLCKNVNFWFSYFLFGVENLFLVKWIGYEEIPHTNTLSLGFKHVALFIFFELRSVWEKCHEMFNFWNRLWIMAAPREWRLFAYCFLITNMICLDVCIVITTQLRVIITTEFKRLWLLFKTLFW